VCVQWIRQLIIRLCESKWVAGGRSRTVVDGNREKVSRCLAQASIYQHYRVSCHMFPDTCELHAGGDGEGED
jgi:hypothetical protein